MAPAAMRQGPGSSGFEERLWPAGEATRQPMGHQRPFKNDWNKSSLVEETLRTLCSKEQSPRVSRSLKVLRQPFSATRTLCPLEVFLEGWSARLRHICSPALVQNLKSWVWGHLFLTTRSARPHGGWKPSPPQPTARRRGSPGGPLALRCICKVEAVSVNRIMLSRCPWARRTGDHQRDRQPGKGFLLLPS